MFETKTFKINLSRIQAAQKVNSNILNCLRDVYSVALCILCINAFQAIGVDVKYVYSQICCHYHLFTNTIGQCCQQLFPPFLMLVEAID